MNNVLRRTIGTTVYRLGHRVENGGPDFDDLTVFIRPENHDRDRAVDGAEPVHAPCKRRSHRTLHLFLDEVGEIPLNLQAKLLRVLETGEFRCVGGTHTLTANVRLVSATNRRLLDEVDAKRFRLDLYYRVAGIDVTLPPLRERAEDLPELAAYILKRLIGNQGSCRLDASAVAALQAYEFPGNVRELRNLLQKAVLNCREGVISAADLQLPAAALPAAQTADVAPLQPEAPQSLLAAERAHIQGLLDTHQGHRARVAAALGITERTLYRKLKQYGLGR
ncbi:MAG: sigma 54-interacting transcriptional regulator [Thiobacillus sp.]